MVTGSDHHAIMIMIHKIIPMTMITVSSSADLRPVPRPPANHGRCRNTGGTTNFFLKHDNYHHYYQMITTRSDDDNHVLCRLSPPGTL